MRNTFPRSWWRHQMGIFSASLALYAGNSPVALNKPLIKQSWGWWFETPTHPLWRHCNDAKTFKRRKPSLIYHCQSLMPIIVGQICNHINANICKLSFWIASNHYIAHLNIHAATRYFKPLHAAQDVFAHQVVSLIIGKEVSWDRAHLKH